MRGSDRTWRIPMPSSQLHTHLTLQAALRQPPTTQGRPFCCSRASLWMEFQVLLNSVLADNGFDVWCGFQTLRGTEWSRKHITTLLFSVGKRVRILFLPRAKPLWRIFFII
ncbi:hypothetical protein AMTRI_Chr03g51350 [Amborella trichopoda]